MSDEEPDDARESPPDADESRRPLKIAILSRKSSLFSTRRLKEAGELRGHKMQVVDYLRCYMNITSHRPTIIYSGRELNDFDAVIPRIGASHTFYGTAVVRQFEMMDIFSANESQAITRSRDKLRCLQLLAREGIGLPVSGFAHSTKDIDGLIDIVGGAPLVVKIVEGTQGVGVILAENRKAAEAVIEAFRGLKANILVQEFIQEAAGSDIRCLVVGGRVVAAMMRTARPGEFRSNLHRGGTAEQVKITPEERTTAVRAAKSMGLRVAGVDILRSRHGPVVMEVNSSPGLEGIEKATEIDVAGRIIEYVAKQAWTSDNKDRVKG
jgi:ribosomal protein S6--L-glutamate ligase